VNIPHAKFQSKIKYHAQNYHSMQILPPPNWGEHLRIILSSTPMPLCQCFSGLENEIRILVEEYFGHHLEEVKNYPPKGVFTIS